MPLFFYFFHPGMPFFFYTVKPRLSFFPAVERCTIFGGSFNRKEEVADEQKQKKLKLEKGCDSNQHSAECGNRFMHGLHDFLQVRA